MKYLKMFNENINGSDIDAICEKYYIKNYNVNDDGTIDVNGNVDLSNEQLTILPLKFRNVSGDFICSYNQLTNLIGSPQYVGGDFYCHFNQLTSLEGCPKKVHGDFSCDINEIKNIDYLPKYYKQLSIEKNPISKILRLFIEYGNFDIISGNSNKELILEFIDREIIQQDILLVNRLVEFLDDIDKPKYREELIELLKNNYTIQ